MASVTDAAAPAEIKVLAFCVVGKRNKRKDYVPQRGLQREPLADITNKPRTREAAAEQPPAIRRRINPTLVGEASTRERLLHLKAMQFVVAVEQYANEYRVAPLLDML
ncbi:g1357 [Coccomyxa elongata]